MFSATNLLTGSNDVLQYIQDNLILFIVAAVCLVAIIVIIIVVAVAKKKAKKQNADTAGEASAKAEPVSADTLTAPGPDAPQAAAKYGTDGEVPAAPTEEAPQPLPAATPAAGIKTKPKPKPGADAECVVDSAPPERPDEEEGTPVVFAPKDETENANKAYAGKWELSRLVVANAAGEEMDSAFFFRLKASNGEPLITSEEYSSERGALQGIETFKTNVARGNFKISITRKGKFIVKLLTNQGNLLAQGEKYSSRAQALSAISSIKRFAESARIDEEAQTVTVPYQESAEAEERTYDATKKGKWVIHKVILEAENDVSYCFDLCASNGQVLFTSEEYSTINSLKNGIRTHKKNIANGNIRAVVTRNGDYIFKIFNGNGQLLCLGGHYKTKQLCLNAIESVKRFAESARLDLDKLFPDEK